MAHKYDLITVPTKPKGPPKHHPWYKERLKLKYLKNSKLSAALEGGRWTFMAGNIDDFRSGVPAETKGTAMVQKGQVSLVPLVDSRSTELLESRRKPQAPQLGDPSTNPGRHTLFRKTGPRQQVQQAHLEEVERSLQDHPLGLYPHLEESIPPELLEDVIGVLDPILKPADSETDLESADDFGASVLPDDMRTAGKPEDMAMEDDGRLEESSESPRQGAIYQWPLKQTEEEQRREQSMLASQKVISPTQESRVNQVTHDLVQWFKNLGGSTKGCAYTVDEAIVKNLFASDSETRPVLVAPIHVVELVNVPVELRLESREWSSHSQRRCSDSAHHRRRAHTVPGMEYEEPRCVKTRYGAWYLPTDLWRVRAWDQPLRDPREDASEAAAMAARESAAMDEVLASLHGARAFKDFITSSKPSANMPHFLKSVKPPKQPSPTRKQLRTNAPVL